MILTLQAEPITVQVFPVERCPNCDEDRPHRMIGEFSVCLSCVPA